MTQPLGNCPGCGADEPFERIHAGDCPDVSGTAMDGECPEWACIACGTGVIMGTFAGSQATASPAVTVAPARQSVRAA
jgi:hypothetical protein